MGTSSKLEESETIKQIAMEGSGLRRGLLMIMALMAMIILLVSEVHGVDSPLTCLKNCQTFCARNVDDDYTTCRVGCTLGQKKCKTVCVKKVQDDFTACFTGCTSGC